MEKAIDSGSSEHRNHWTTNPGSSVYNALNLTDPSIAKMQKTSVEMANATTQGGAAGLSTVIEPMISTDTLLSNRAGATGGSLLTPLAGTGVATSAFSGVTTVVIDTIAEDAIINALEHRQPLEVKGTSLGLGVGEVFAIELNDRTYTAEIGTSGSWMLLIDAADIQALSDGRFTITTSVDDGGNLVSVVHDVVVDVTTPTLVINTISGTHVIDSDGLGQSLTLEGMASGLPEGEQLEIALNGKTYSATVAEDGSWSVEVSTEDLADLRDGSYTIVASVADISGNIVSDSPDVSVNGYSGLVKESEEFDSEAIESLAAGESYTYASGMTLKGVENGDSPDEGAFTTHDGDSGTLCLTHGAIGEISFGHQIEGFSFQYKPVGYVAFVEIYDSNGGLIDKTMLEGMGGGSGDGYLDYSYVAPDGVMIDHVRIDVSDAKRDFVMEDFEWGYQSGEPAFQRASEGISDGVDVLSAGAMDGNVVSESKADDHLESTADDDHFTIDNGGNDLLIYHLLNSADDTGNNGVDRVSGFTVGSIDEADRIDLHELLADTEYRGSAEGEPNADTLAEFVRVTVKDDDTEIAIDRDGAGNSHEMTTLVTLSDVQTDLATLLANQQLVV